MRTYDIRQGLAALTGAGIAGGLVWVAAAYVSDRTTGGYWATLGIVMGAGFVLVLAPLLGGRPRGGGPPVSPGTFLIAFVPAAIVAAWIAVSLEPHGTTARDHLLNWSGDIGVRDVVVDLNGFAQVLAFGLGSLLGFSLAGSPVRLAGPVPVEDDFAADEPVSAERRMPETEETRVG